MHSCLIPHCSGIIFLKVLISDLSYENFSVIAYCRFSWIIRVLTSDDFQVMLGSACNITTDLDGTLSIESLYFFSFSIFAYWI